MLARTPERQLSTQLARTAVGPASIVAAGAGVLIGELAHLSIGAAIAVGVGAWGVRMLGALANTFRRARRRPPPVMVDPYAVVEPWRSMVRQAVDARDRFAETVAGWPDGPLRDRLTQLTGRVTAGTEEVFRVAKQAAALTTAAERADAEGIGRELAEVQRERTRRPPDQRAELDARESSLANRLKSVRHMQTTAARASDRLGVLVAQLNDAVTSVIELSFGPVDTAMARDLLGSLEGLVDELEALHLAAGETGDIFGSPPALDTGAGAPSGALPPPPAAAPPSQPPPATPPPQPQAAPASQPPAAQPSPPPAAQPSPPPAAPIPRRTS